MESVWCWQLNGPQYFSHQRCSKHEIVRDRGKVLFYIESITYVILLYMQHYFILKVMCLHSGKQHMQKCYIYNIAVTSKYWSKPGFQKCYMSNIDMYVISILSFVCCSDCLSFVGDAIVRVYYAIKPYVWSSLSSFQQN